MKDIRMTKLADNLVNYSCQVQQGEKVLIEFSGPEASFVEELVDAVYAAGGMPFVNNKNARVNRKLLRQMTEEQFRLWTDMDSYRMDKMDAYIGVRGSENDFELADVLPGQLEKYNLLYQKPVHMDIRVKKTKWVILRYPTPSFSQMAGMSTESFEDFFFDVCNLDYAKMSRAMDPLVALINRTDRVQIKGPGTDLKFSIKGIGAIKCDGSRNIPDGEVYTAPVRDSVNGVISYNAPSNHESFRFENIRFEFVDGKIVKATSNDNEKINKILDTDEGARYIGEFAIGVNPYITKPMMDTLFDEKIAGSFHLTPGGCYDECSNNNDSAIHWDLVLMQDPASGGGEIIFDDVVIRRDGRFILDELQSLNPENLK